MSASQSSMRTINILLTDRPLTENAIPVMSNSGFGSSSCTDGITGTVPVVGSMARTLRRFSRREVENADDGPWKATTVLVDTKRETATESFICFNNCSKRIQEYKM